MLNRIKGYSYISFTSLSIAGILCLSSCSTGENPAFRKISVGVSPVHGSIPQFYWEYLSAFGGTSLTNGGPNWTNGLRVLPQ